MKVYFGKPRTGKTYRLVKEFLESTEDKKILLVLNREEKERILIHHIPKNKLDDYKGKIITFSEFLTPQRRLGLNRGTKVFIDNMDVLFSYFDNRLNYTAVSFTVE